MPYIITTRRSAKRLQPGQSTYDETAVATLSEARCAAQSAQDQPTLESIQAAWSLPESGGTIGPLPDGTVIEVREEAA